VREAGIAVRYTNCTIITSSTSLVSGNIGELGEDENCYVGAEQAKETKRNLDSVLNKLEKEKMGSKRLYQL
jgi:hypothetical protein